MYPEWKSHCNCRLDGERRLTSGGVLRSGPAAALQNASRLVKEISLAGNSRQNYLDLSCKEKICSDQTTNAVCATPKCHSSWAGSDVCPSHWPPTLRVYANRLRCCLIQAGTLASNAAMLKPLVLVRDCVATSHFHTCCRMSNGGRANPC